MSPVTKVVKLLEGMQTTLQTEKEQDEDAYAKFSCWCTTNENEKTEAISIAERLITKYTTAVETNSAKAGQLQGSINNLKKEIADNQNALAEATKLREKENGEFSAQEQDLLSSIASLTAAVEVLSKHQTFLQVPAEVATEVHAPLQRLLDSKSLQPSQKRELVAFLQQPADFKSYNSRSGSIFGILSQMKETFESDLSKARAEEAHSLSEYSNLKAAKTSEITAGQKLLNEQVTELANTKIALADANHALADTRKKQSADQAFVTDLTQRCDQSAREYDQRTSDRAAEMSAVSDVINILTDDSARDLFNAQVAFIQRGVSSRRLRAATLLQTAARKAGSNQLQKVATSVQLDAFTKVTAAIDDMVSALKKEMADEITHQRFCNDELNKNTKQQDATQDNLNDLKSSIEQGESTVDTLSDEIKNLENEVTEMSVQLKAASEQREAENKEFQQTVADQRAVQTLLAKALARLEQVYLPKAALVQSSQPVPGAAAPPPPPAFKDNKGYSQSQGSTGVMALIQKIMSEANQLENEDLHAEQESQSAYEEFVANTKKAVEAARRSITDKKEQTASTQVRLESDKSDEAGAKQTMYDLQQFNAQLHASCDYVLNNFDMRQNARQEEIDALNQAKSILKGAKY